MIDFIFENATFLGLFLFFSTFLAIAIWTYTPRNKKKIESYKYIPLLEKK